MVSLSALIGDNGILTNATEAVDETGSAGAKEAFELALSGAMADYYNEKTKGNTSLTSSEYITIAMIREGLGSSYQYCSSSSSAENTADDDKTLVEIYNENGGAIYLSEKGSTGSGTIYKITFDIVDGNVTNIAVSVVDSSSSGETDVEIISTEESYIGYYADVDGDGNVDGIIYADLAIGGNVDSYDSYEYDAIDSSSLKQYKISGEYEDTYFGMAEIVTPVNDTNGENRFYIMALEDVDDNDHYWYYNASGNLPSNLDDYDFGKGLTNTEYWLEIYENETYGAQYTSGSYTELWGIEEVGSYVGNSKTSIWFIPSTL